MFSRHLHHTCIARGKSYVILNSEMTVMLVNVSVDTLTNFASYYGVGVTENCLTSSKMELVGLSRFYHENYPLEEVNDTNDFQSSKLGGPIELE